MRMTKPQFFYHITESRWPRYKRLSPKRVYQEDEPQVSRICVSPTISQCISAVGSNSRRYIYRTLHRVSGQYPWQVADVRITRERWLRKPTTFIRIGDIHPDIFREMLETISIPTPAGYKDELERQAASVPEIRDFLQQRLDCTLLTKLGTGL